eukprot:jgi/Mesvir1/2927/Mv13994-RA.1
MRSSSPSSSVALSPAAAPLEWKFGQVFGERAPGEEVQDADIISAVEFDRSGDNLATGDRGGRVVLFERVDSSQLVNGRRAAERAGPAQRGVEFKYSTEFQSHEPEFDYLKSLEIEEKINKIRWCESSNGARFVLSTNDKTVKLWKVFDKKVKCLSNYNLHPPGTHTTSISPAPVAGPGARLPAKRTLGSAPAAGGGRPPGKPEILQLKVPSVASTEIVTTARCRRVFANAHAYHINSISVNSDRETYMSADDLRVNLWNLEISEQSFNIVDIKPTNMEDLTEVITSAEFHPKNCYTFAYSSSKGAIRLGDMREAALCDKKTKSFEEPETSGSRSFFSEIIASISDIKFCPSGRYLVSRDYMTLKLWDLNMENAPVAVFKVHEQLRSKLCDLYENDSIFDKFECCINGRGDHVATGSYSNLFRVFNSTTPNDDGASLECSKTPTRRTAQVAAKPSSRLGSLARGRDSKRAGGSAPGSPRSDSVNDFGSKLLHMAWHPKANMIACGAANSLYMFYA